MFEFSRQLYRDIAGFVEPPAAGDGADTRLFLLGCIELAMHRLQEDPSKRERIERWLLREVRFCFPLCRLPVVRRAVKKQCAAAAAYVLALPQHGVDSDGNPVICTATTRHGSSCRRPPLANGLCPSHQRWARSDDAPRLRPVPHTG